MTNFRWVLAVAALLSLFVVAVSLGAPFNEAVPAQEAEARPRILVTNDDGIQTPGLRVLVAELADFADVTVCAPPGNRSGSSASISLFNSELILLEDDVEGAVRAVTLSGTPADCSAYGLGQLSGDRPFDMLISGINHGSNVGAASHYSGTVGAAMEAARRGVPAIAASMGRSDVKAAAAFVALFARQWIERGTDSSVVYSINIPDGAQADWKGVRSAPMGELYLSMDGWMKTGDADGETTLRCRPSVLRDYTEGTDSDLYFQGFVTVCPLRFDWTHREALEGLEEWTLELE